VPGDEALVGVAEELPQLALAQPGFFPVGPQVVSRYAIAHDGESALLRPLPLNSINRIHPLKTSGYGARAYFWSAVVLPSTGWRDEAPMNTSPSVDFSVQIKWIAPEFFMKIEESCWAIGPK